MVRIIAEGERVQAGDSIFRYYSKNEDNLIKKIEELDIKIDEALQNEEKIYPSDVKVLDSTIEKNIEESYEEMI